MVGPEDEIKNYIKNEAPKLVDNNNKIHINAVYDFNDEELIYDYTYSDVSKKMKEITGDDNFEISVDFIDDDLHKANIKVGYSYTFRHKGEYFWGVYCPTYIEEGSEGFNCYYEMKNVTLVYADEEGRITKSDINTAKELAKKYDKKEFPSYLNVSFEEYVKNERTYDKYMEIFQKNAHIDSLLKDYPGYSIELDTRAGDDSFGKAELLGYGKIIKNGVVLAAADRVRIYQVMKVEVPKSGNYKIEDLIISQVKKLLGDNNAKVEVSYGSSDISNKEVYVISINSSKLSEVISSKTYEISRMDGVIKPSVLSLNSDSMSVSTFVEEVDEETETQEGSSQSENIDLNLDEFKIVSAGTKNVKLSWNKVSGAKGYIVYRSTNNKKWTKVTTTKSSVLTYNNKKLSSGKKYYYKVKAYKVVKKKNKTIVTSKVINTKTKPVAPKVKIKTSSYNSVTVNVSKVTGASKYVIERSTDKKNYTSVGELTKAGNFKDTNVLTGTNYYYRVKACNERCSGYSKVVSVKPSLKKPTLKLVAGKKKVTIKLPGVSGADGYVIVKSTKKNKGFKEVANVDYATKTFDEENLKSKKTYYYKVRAYKLVNGKPVYSSYSKVYKVKVK